MQARLASTMVAALLVAATTAQTVIVPPVANGADGNSSTTWPFDVALIHAQYVYDSSNFTLQGITSPILITAIKLRANQTATSTTAQTWTGGTSQLQLDLSTAPIDYSLVTSTFASNQGANKLTVFNGPITTPAGNTTVGQVGPFYFTVNFTTPFLYDPAGGDLTIDYLSSGVSTAAMPTLDLVTTTGAALARRVTNTTSLTATTGTVTAGEAANPLEISYTPAVGLFASFFPSNTGGPTPLTVTFISTSYTSDPGGITSYAWDFDGDSVIDSTAAVPSFVYTGCGNFNVSLTVTDATHPPSTTTRNNLISTDDITASFTVNLLLAPNVFQLTDTSTPPATSWAWDTDGDNVVDNTTQNPVVVLPQCQSRTFTLTATRNCKSSTTARTQFVASNSLTSLFGANNGGSSGWLVFNDISVTNPVGINICGLAHNTGTTAVGTPFTVNVLLTNDTYVGKDNDATQWRQVATGSGVAAGNDQPSISGLSPAIWLPPGNYGMAIQINGASVRYTGTATGGSPFVFTNSDLTLSTGAVRSTFFAGGSFFSIREWNGTIYYDTPQTGATAGYGWFGTGCAGSLGVSRQTLVTPPIIGTTFSTSFDNLPFSAVFAIIGFSNTLFGGSVPLPIELTPLGAPGCFARISYDMDSLTLGTANQATLSAGVPLTTTLQGVPFFVEGGVFDTVNALGLVFSEAWGGVIGY